MKTCRVRAVVVIAVVFLTLSFSAEAERSADPKLEKALKTYMSQKVLSRYGDSVQIGAYVAEAKSGRMVFDHGGDALLSPASALKIITSAAALRVLGSDYRFPTEFFVDRAPSEYSPVEAPGVKSAGARVGNVYIRGYGDPTLINERLWEMAQALARDGVSVVEDIVVDDGLFIDPPAASGRRPYEAGLSAASLNHNCYGVYIAPGQPGKRAFVELSPGAPFELSNQVVTRTGVQKTIRVIQTPSSAGYRRAMLQTDKASAPISSKPRVSVTVKGVIGTKTKADAMYFTVPDPPLYLGWVFRHFLEQSGVGARGTVRVGETPESAKLFRTFESKELKLVLRDLNHYSNNFIAGQLLFAMGQDSVGYFRLDVGIERIRAMLTDLGIPENSYSIYDGSGLDRRNKVSARQLVAVLVGTFQDFSVAPDYVASLSRFGSSGTLKKRRLLEGGSLSGSSRLLERKKRLASGVWGKTGTLTAVSSVAGYAESERGERLAYTLFVIGGIGKRAATDIEDDFLRIVVGVR